jgi:hypothetical protein
LIEKLREEFAGQIQFFGINNEDFGTVQNFLRKNNSEIAAGYPGGRGGELARLSTGDTSRAGG